MDKSFSNKLAEKFKTVYLVAVTVGCVAALTGACKNTAKTHDTELRKPKIIYKSYIVEPYMDTVLVLNNMAHTYEPRYAGEPMEYVLELADRNGEHISYALSGARKTPMSPVRSAMRGDSLLVRRAITADGVRELGVIRNITADRIAREFARQK